MGGDCVSARLLTGAGVRAGEVRSLGDSVSAGKAWQDKARGHGEECLQACPPFSLVSQETGT